MQKPLYGDPKRAFAINLLDVGPAEYGDSTLCLFGDVSILIDGGHPGDQTGKKGHPSIPDQLGLLLGQSSPYRVSLLVVTHAHDDHIGCLPDLVRHDLLRADWALVADPGLGWGRPNTDAGDGESSDVIKREPRARQLVAALRAETRTLGTSDEDLRRFMYDAADLEQRYLEMIANLRDRGTQVVCYGRDPHEALQHEFENVGLTILGPSEDQLLLCADTIAKRTAAALAMVTDYFHSEAVSRQDAVPDPVSLYRELVGHRGNGLDAARRIGPAINLQSIVLRLTYRGYNCLFTGDMQFAEPELPAVEEQVHRLRQTVCASGPFSFVKLAHHGSYNGLNEDVFSELAGTRFFGMSAGSSSTLHPHPRTLRILAEHAQRITWARTDHNGLTTLSLGPEGLAFKPSAGTLNDPEPNAPDEVPPAGGPSTTMVPRARATPPEIQAPVPPIVSAIPLAVESPPGIVEVVAKVPHVTTRVTLTIDVAPGASTGQVGQAPIAVDLPQQLQLASRRPLPDLLFVTSRGGLAQNIGYAEAALVVQSVRAAGKALYDEIPPDLPDSAGAEARVLAQLQKRPSVAGVVLIGGYDVVPAQRLDTLDPFLRASLRNPRDPDNFVVWSDAVYGDVDGDGLPEVPVSRIPDGRSAQLVFAALQSNKRPYPTRRAGIRNAKRPFADGIFAGLPGPGELHASEPVRHDIQPPYDLGADGVYFMLHGDYVDGSCFWGEDDVGGNLEAVRLTNVPARGANVIFSGCCWGALVVDTPASQALPGRALAPRTAENSIALSFLARGATAFVGCTGAHYSPLEPPYQYNGGPLHTAFWQQYVATGSPAQALFRAQIDYIAGIPHGQRDPLSHAVENKTLRQFTCLGLGW